LQEEPPPLSLYVADLDPRLEAICGRAMAKPLGDRYASMRELVQDLTEFLDRDAPPEASLSPTLSAARTKTPEITVQDTPAPQKLAEPPTVPADRPAAAGRRFKRRLKTAAILAGLAALASAFVWLKFFAVRQDPHELRQYLGHTGEVWSVAFSPDGL